MPSDSVSFTFGYCPTNPHEFEVRDAHGKVLSTLTIPIGLEVRVIPSPWWIRLSFWLRLQAWRARSAWGRA